MVSVTLTAKKHASDSRRGCAEPDKGTRLGVFDGIQAVHVSNILDHLNATLLCLHVFAIVAFDGSHVDVNALRLDSKKVNGVWLMWVMQCKYVAGKEDADAL